MRRVFKIIIVSVCLLLISQFAIAQGLVPSGCQTGCPCTLCDLYELARNFINFLLFVLAIPIGALMFLYGGVTLLTSQGNPNKLTQGKTVLVNAVIGLAIAFFAYVIIGALLSTLAFEISFGGALRQWYQPPSCELRSGGGTCTTEFPTPPTGPPPPSGPLSSGVDDTCVEDGFGTCSATQQGLADGSLCQGALDPLAEEGCSWDPNPKTEFTSLDANIFNSNLAANISDAELQAIAAEHGVPVSRIKAIIAAESSANNNATHTDLDGGTSYGLMQIRPETARVLDPNGLVHPDGSAFSDAEVVARLRDPAYNINLGTKYYANLEAKYGDPTLASAAYNGGPVANQPSKNCPGLKRWQCLWDDDAQTIQNERTGHPGYGPTRKYIDNINGLELLF